MKSNPLDQVHPKYRSDIDGLRAVAVLAVVVFHAFPSILKGGFIGVDIFFVISGFLISSIIFDNLDRNRFSFIEFYSRRIKRIFPALLIVLIACFVFGWLELTAPDFKRLGKHIGWGAGFLSNFVLLKESGYFDASADVKPLLHLWSLGIEEQFYIIWPLLIWGAWRLRFNRLLLLLIIGVASFALNIRMSHDQNEIARLYYSPQTRFWELLIGAALACVGSDKTLKKPICRVNAWLASMNVSSARFANARSFLGVCLLSAGLCWITNDKPFPGWYALLPTMGAALIISADMHAWINRHILANKVVVWFGLISFPLYLWHWPLLSFARILETDTPSVGIRTALVGLSVALAWMTTSFIERPIRFGKPASYKTIALATAMIAIGLAGFYTFVNEGLPSRYGVTALQMTPGRYECEGLEKNSGCAFGNPNSNKLVIVWGDSHAEQYTNALRLALGDQYKFLAVTNGSCFMGEKVVFPNMGSKRDCGAAIEKIRSLHGQSIYAVIRVQRWHGYLIQSKSDVENAVNDAIIAYDLRPQKIIIMGATPDVNLECEVSNYYTRPLVSKKICTPLNFRVTDFVKSFIEITKAMPVPGNVHFIYPYEIVCPANLCRVIEGNIAYFEDTHHLSTEGALRVVPYIAKVLNEDDGQPAAHVTVNGF